LWAQRKFQVDKGIAYGIAKKVQKKIALKGTKGQFMFKQTAEDIEDALGKMFEMAPEIIAEKLSKL
jgi:hypothetical protein